MLCNKEINNCQNYLNIFCNGNPYIVSNLILISIINNFNLKLNIDDTMVGVNKYLIKIINNILIKNNLKIKIELFEKLNNEKNIIFIDRINDYNLIKLKNKNVKIIPYQSIDIYSDSEEFEELFEKIYNYALDMNIDIDIFNDEGIESLIKYGKGKIKLILTNNNELIKKYNGENIFINQNPFKEKSLIFDEKTISMIDY